jgi:integrase
VKEQFYPWLCIGGFAGIRTDFNGELFRMDWSMVKWEKSLFDLPAHVTKKGRRRLVPLRENLAELIAPWRHATGQIVTGRPDAETARLSRNVISWKTNALRHSYGTYRAAELKDIGKLAYEMGNSIAMIQRHYDAVAHEDESTKYFAIRPAASNVVRMPVDPNLTTLKCR